MVAPHQGDEMLKDWGKMLDSNAIEQGLRELNRDIHFDMGTKLGMWHPHQESRQGVYYSGTHICSMDRGMVPEFKVWSVAERIVPVSFDRCEDDDVTLRYEVLSGRGQEYSNLKDEVARGLHDDKFIRPDGKVVRLIAVKAMKVRDKVILVGWRHTFEKLINANIPGVTRSSIAMKFNVDMLKFPMGPPAEVVAALTEE